MNKRIKKAWVKALRSGEYKQGNGQLCRNDRFCCLGVLYDIAHDGYWHKGTDGQSWLTDERSGEFLYGEDFGLSDDMQENLSDMNDEYQSFAQIADYIEQNL